MLQELARSRACDAVLLDLHMPGMSGVETARAIRRLDTSRGRVPILAITAHASAAMSEEALAAGIGAILLKPVELEGLYEALAALMGVPAPDRPEAAAAR